MGQAGSEPSPWALRLDIASTRVLLWLARPSESRPLRPEVHLFLADRYGRLARVHARSGRRELARRSDEKAAHHFRLGGGEWPPPAVAVAMAIPRHPLFTDARGIYVVGTPVRPGDPARRP
jgi:hypothetical protein